MTRLEAVIEKLKALPEDEQEALLSQIEQALDAEGSLLTDEQWAEVERELAEDDGVRLSHEDVVAHMKARFGE